MNTARITLRPSQTNAPQRRLEHPRSDDHGSVSLHLDKDLMEWLKAYAHKYRTTPNQLIVDLIVELQKDEAGEGIQQI